MGGVVVARTTREGQPASDGERPVPLVEAQPELGRGHLDRRREARVQVDVGDVVDSGARQLNDGTTARADGGGRAEIGALGHEPVVVAVGTGVDEDLAVLGHARRAGGGGRAHDEGRRLVGLDVGVHQLEVGEADHPVVGRGGADLLRGAGDGRPRRRVLGRHLREPGPQA